MLNDKLLNLIKSDEGFSQFVYKDTVGVLTIGYGRNLEKKGISKEEADLLLKNDVEAILKELKITLPFFETLSENRKNVLVSMAYNLGVSGLLGFSKMMYYVKCGQFEEASKEMLNSLWASQVRNRAIRLSDLMLLG